MLTCRPGCATLPRRSPFPWIYYGFHFVFIRRSLTLLLSRSLLESRRHLTEATDKEMRRGAHHRRRSWRTTARWPLGDVAIPWAEERTGTLERWWDKIEVVGCHAVYTRICVLRVFWSHLVIFSDIANLDQINQVLCKRVETNLPLKLLKKLSAIEIRTRAVNLIVTSWNGHRDPFSVYTYTIPPSFTFSKWH